MKEEGTYYPARDGEGLTVFMMGSIMLEYNRKPLQLSLIHIFIYLCPAVCRHSG